jgi:hypothetical protein
LLGVSLCPFRRETVSVLIFNKLRLCLEQSVSLLWLAVIPLDLWPKESTLPHYLMTALRTFSLAFTRWADRLTIVQIEEQDSKICRFSSSTLSFLFPGSSIFVAMQLQDLLGQLSNLLLFQFGPLALDLCFVFIYFF